MASKKTQFITTAAMIAAVYVVLTYLVNAIGLASGAVQIRLSEAINVLACFTSATIPGMYVGCLVANILTGGCPLDIVFGGLATLIGVSLGRLIAVKSKGRLNVLVPIPTIVANALIVPLVLQKGYGIDTPYHYLMLTVGVGEIISAGFIGWILYFALANIPHFKQLINNSITEVKKKDTKE